MSDGEVRNSQSSLEALLRATDAEVRVTQEVVEFIRLPAVDQQNARITQMAIELTRLPDAADIRITQMVIELIKAQPGAGANGWIVREV